MVSQRPCVDCHNPSFWISFLRSLCSHPASLPVLGRRSREVGERLPALELAVLDDACGCQCTRISKDGIPCPAQTRRTGIGVARELDKGRVGLGTRGDWKPRGRVRVVQGRQAGKQANSDPPAEHWMVLRAEVYERAGCEVMIE